MPAPDSPRLRPLTAAARWTATAGLGSLGLLHLAWASGSHWPASSGHRLAIAVVGAPVPPARTPTAVVSAGLLLSAIIVSGVVDGGRLRRSTAIVIGGAMSVRAALGGSGAARLITSRAPAPAFVKLDRCCYRPACAAVAAALFASALD